MTAFAAPVGPAPAAHRVTSVTPAQLDSLADLLVDVVDGDGSASFMHPLAVDRAAAFWRRAAADVTAGDRALLLAEDELGVVGTVQLVPAQPANQPHRADVAKLLVHRPARRRGLGAALMHAGACDEGACDERECP